MADIARHPSETDERMMMRARSPSRSMCRPTTRALEFAKDLWDTDEPGALAEGPHRRRSCTWIDVGQPDERRIAKASGRADRVIVIAYAGRTADIWWQGVRAKVERMQNVTVWSLADGVAERLGALAERTMRLQMTVQDGEVSLGSATVDPVAISWNVLKAPGK